MPFKGDRRLGGPHDNEASLNGTSSDFDSVPAYGTVLSGPTDTSRNVNDFLGTPFYMPYSTTVYADGLGGENPVETWGLQYYPAGWVTATSSTSQFVTWNFATSGEGLTTSGNLEWGFITEKHVEDGTGINYTAYLSTTCNFTDGQVLASDQVGTGADRYRVTFDLASKTATFHDFTIYPVYGTINGYSSGNLTHSAPCQTFNIGTYSTPNLADGYGSTFSGGSSNTYDSASYLGHCGDYANGWHFYYHDGGGTVTEGNAPAGFQLYYDSSSSSFAWSAPDGTSGTFTYATSENFQNADGSGGIIYNGNSWNATEGDVITSGTYLSGQTYDPSTDSYVDNYSPYNLTYIYQNGSHTYNTNYP